MIRQTIYFALIALLLMGCSDEVLDSRGNSGEGRLILSCISVESVVGDIQTRASLEQDVIPTAADFTLTIVEASTSQLVKTLQKGDTDCFLPVGSYKVRASYGDEAAMSEIPYFFGESQAVDIKEGESSTVEIQASLACAVIHPIVDPQLEAQFNWLALTANETTLEKSPKVENIPFGKDFFVRGGDGHTYTFALVGENMLGETKTYTWEYNNLVVRTRYKINCNPDLPAFTMPDQPEGNVWSKFIYINPMTADNMTAHKDMADMVIEKVVYEASKDNGETWITSEKLPDGRHVIKGLEPSTQYTIRSRFGGVTSSDSHFVTTESAQPMENGDMETWEQVPVANAYNGKFYDYFLGSEKSSVWKTNNSEGLDGATTHASQNIGTYWRWCAGTISTTDVSTLNPNTKSTNAAEVSTLGFYTKPITWRYVGTISSSEIIPKWLSAGNRICLGKLYADKAPLVSRPTSISFDFKYQPVSGDLASVEVALFDSNLGELWKESMTLSAQLEYSTKKVSIDHQLLDGKKVAFITLRFQSGTNTDYRLMHVVEGDYDASPRVRDRVVGSVLKIDNVTLNYDYE